MVLALHLISLANLADTKRATPEQARPGTRFIYFLPLPAEGLLPHCHNASVSLFAGLSNSELGQSLYLAGVTASTAPFDRWIKQSYGASISGTQGGPFVIAATVTQAGSSERQDKGAVLATKKEVGRHQD